GFFYTDAQRESDEKQLQSFFSQATRLEKQLQDEIDKRAKKPEKPADDPRIKTLEDRIRALLAKKEDATAEELSDYDKLMNAAIDMRTVLEAEWSSTEKLTEAQRALAKGKKDLTDGVIAASTPQKEEYVRYMQRNIAIEHAVKLREEEKKANEASLKTMLDSLATIEKDNAEIRKHNEEIGLSSEALLELNQRRLDGTILLKEEEMSSLLASGTAAQLAADEIKKETEERKRSWEETDRFAKETFISWAVDGGNAAQKIGDTLKRSLLSAVYDAQLKPLVFQVYGNTMSALGGGAVSGAGGSLGGSFLSSAGGSFAGSGLSMVAGQAGGLFGGAGNAIANYAAGSMGITVRCRWRTQVRGKRLSVQWQGAVMGGNCHRAYDGFQYVGYCAAV
ncbi:MAG: hypothetical protein NTX56_05450, partial [Proteobacteria bacterium]|nr:hypothetical protein [Pseudomonadota bacterium]